MCVCVRVCLLEVVLILHTQHRKPLSSNGARPDAAYRVRGARLPVCSSSRNTTATTKIGQEPTKTANNRNKNEPTLTTSTQNSFELAHYLRLYGLCAAHSNILLLLRIAQLFRSLQCSYVEPFCIKYLDFLLWLPYLYVWLRHFVLLVILLNGQIGQLMMHAVIDIIHTFRTCAKANSMHIAYHECFHSSTFTRPIYVYYVE